jgi:polar amino acid transport system permease protein
MPGQAFSPAWSGGVVLLIFIALSIARHADAAAPTALPSAFATLLLWTPFILGGFLLNLAMSFIAMALATVLGTVLGLMEISPSRLIRLAAGSYMQLFRNTPWIVILFAVMLLLPFQIPIGNGAHVLIPDWIKATFALSLPVAANVAEIVRGAVLSIPTGQWESAESLAFPRWKTLWMIILPQCIRRMIPPWMNWYAILALSTPTTAILGVREAVGSAQQAMEASGGRTVLLLPFYLFILAIFFIYIYPISRLTLWLERKYAVKG